MAKIGNLEVPEIINTYDEYGNIVPSNYITESRLNLMNEQERIKNYNKNRPIYDKIESLSDVQILKAMKLENSFIIRRKEHIYINGDEKGYLFLIHNRGLFGKNGMKIKNLCDMEEFKWYIMD